MAHAARRIASRFQQWAAGGSHDVRRGRCDQGSRTHRARAIDLRAVDADVPQRSPPHTGTGVVSRNCSPAPPTPPGCHVSGSTTCDTPQRRCSSRPACRSRWSRNDSATPNRSSPMHTYQDLRPGMGARRQQACNRSAHTACRSAGRVEAARSSRPVRFLDRREPPAEAGRPRTTESIGRGRSSRAGRRHEQSEAPTPRPNERTTDHDHHRHRRHIPTAWRTSWSNVASSPRCHPSRSHRRP